MPVARQTERIPLPFVKEVYANKDKSCITQHHRNDGAAIIQHIKSE